MLVGVVVGAAVVGALDPPVVVGVAAVVVAVVVVGAAVVGAAVVRFDGGTDGLTDGDDEQGGRFGAGVGQGGGTHHRRAGPGFDRRGIVTGGQRPGGHETNSGSVLATVNDSPGART